jgi:hypothetical protein
MPDVPILSNVPLLFLLESNGRAGSGSQVNRKYPGSPANIKNTSIDRVNGFVAVEKIGNM